MDHRRDLALQLADAFEKHVGNAPASRVVERAEIYLAFLKGGDRPALADAGMPVLRQG